MAGWVGDNLHNMSFTLRLCWNNKTLFFFTVGKRQFYSHNDRGNGTSKAEITNRAFDISLLSNKFFTFIQPESHNLASNVIKTTGIIL